MTTEVIDKITTRFVMDDIWSVIRSNNGTPAMGVSEMMVLTERITLAVREILITIYGCDTEVANQLIMIMAMKVTDRETMTNEETERLKAIMKAASSDEGGNA